LILLIINIGLRTFENEDYILKDYNKIKHKMRYKTKNKHRAATTHFRYDNIIEYPYHDIRKNIHNLGLHEVSYDADVKKHKYDEVYQLLVAIQILGFDDRARRPVCAYKCKSELVVDFQHEEMKKVSGFDGYKYYEIDEFMIKYLFQNKLLNIKRPIESSGYDFIIETCGGEYGIQLTTMNLQNKDPIEKHVKKINDKINKLKTDDNNCVFVLSLFPDENLKVIGEKFYDNNKVIIFDAHHYFLYFNIIKNKSGEDFYIHEFMHGNNKRPEFN
jgi:hypothetical protein